MYEFHNYDPPSSWMDLFITPALTLPVIMGELGPEASADYGDQMEGDSEMLMNMAESLQIPYAGWVFDQNCNGKDGTLDMISVALNGHSDDCRLLDLVITATMPWGAAVMTQLQSQLQAPGTT